MLSRWKTLERTTINDCRIFTVDKVRRTVINQEGNNIAGDFFVLNSPNWVNIIPLTPAGHVVMIKQYRHGVDDFTLEVPGGLVDEGEDPCKAAMRECIEETGYSADADAELLGVNQPNPAFLDNVCHCYLWRNCTLRGAQGLDEHEDIEVVEVSMEEAFRLIQTGVIQHSLVLVAFLFHVLHTQQGIVEK